MAKDNNRHQKIAQVMLSGKPVSPKDFAEVFKGTDTEPVLYRLSTYIYDIKKYENGVIRVHKDGRKVVAYELINYDEFNDDGSYRGPVPVVADIEYEPKVADSKDPVVA